MIDMALRPRDEGFFHNCGAEGAGGINIGGRGICTTKINSRTLRL